jgi:hypothetical protein
MKKSKKFRDINEVCTILESIIERKDNNSDYKSLYWDLENALENNIDFLSINRFCEIALKTAITKSRVLRHLEKDIWIFINKLPSYLFLSGKLEFAEYEIIEPNVAYENNEKRIISRVLGLAYDILKLPVQNSNSFRFIRTQSLEFIAQLLLWYIIPDAKEIFVKSIQSENSDEQYNALQSLANYYSWDYDEIEDELLNIIDEIFEETDNSMIASTCLEIQVNVGLMDETTALFELDDWKERHD